MDQINKLTLSCLFIFVLLLITLTYGFIGILLPGYGLTYKGVNLEMNYEVNPSLPIVSSYNPYNLEFGKTFDGAIVLHENPVSSLSPVAPTGEPSLVSKDGLELLISDKTPVILVYIIGLSIFGLSCILLAVLLHRSIIVPIHNLKKTITSSPEIASLPARLPLQGDDELQTFAKLWNSLLYELKRAIRASSGTRDMYGMLSVQSFIGGVIGRVLADNREVYRVIAEHMDTPIMVLDRSFKVQYANPSAKNLFTSLDIRITGEDIRSILPQSKNNSLYSRTEEVIETRCKLREKVPIITDTGTIWLDVSIFPLIGEDEKVDQIHWVMQDITSIVQLASKMEQEGISLTVANAARLQSLILEVRVPVTRMYEMLEKMDHEKSEMLKTHLSTISEFINQLEEAGLRSEKVHSFLLRHYKHGQFSSDSESEFRDGKYLQ